jgi:SAM-dependent methyltransferase
MRILLNPDYEAAEALRLAYIRSDVARRMDASEGASLLDVGCSQLTLMTGTTHLEVFGVDRRRPANVDPAHFRECDLDADGIPFEDSTFDFVMAGEVVEHVKRPFELIEELARVLKPYGVLYLSTPNPYYYLEILKELLGIQRLDDDEHLNLFSRAHLLAYCRRQALQLLGIRRYKFWIPFVKLMVCSLNTPRILNYQNIFVFTKLASSTADGTRTTNPG